MTERKASASTVEEAEDADTAEMEKLEELIDRVKVTPPGEARRAYLLELAAAVTADVRAADFADGHGGRDLLLKSMDGAMRVGDEELMDAVGAAVAARSRCADATDAVELLAVGGSQVGAASQRPPGVEVVRLHKAEADVHVHESSWSDAGLAWRIWGASRIMAHALDAAAHAERSFTRGSDGASSPSPEKKTRGDASRKKNAFRETDDETAPEADAPFIRVRGARVLELGAGCGLGGLAAFELGAEHVVLTEGAPGALAALARSAEAAGEGTRGRAEDVVGNRATAARAPRVAFLDWRDDQAAMEREAEVEAEAWSSRATKTADDSFPSEPSERSSALPRVGSGTSVLEIRRRELASSDGEDVDALEKKTPSSFARGGDRHAVAPSSRHWVHSLRGGACALADLPRLGERETFDLIIGSDLLYDETHCAPLAACLARRLERAERARAHVVLAVRRGVLIAALCRAAHERWGLRFEVRALEVFEEERALLAQQQGGHIARAETPGAEAWRVAGGETFARAGAPVLASPFSPTSKTARRDRKETAEGGTAFRGVKDDAASADAGIGVCRLEAEMAKMEGRVAMVSFRWPRRAEKTRENVI